MVLQVLLNHSSLFFPYLHKKLRVGLSKWGDMLLGELFPILK